MYNQNFEELFPKLLYQLNKHPSLIFLDQNGIKFLSAKYFKELEKTSKTDFLYFVSSSYFWRFGKGKEFKVHLDVDIDLAKKQGYKQIHRTITQQLKNNLPANSRLKLHSFSLKKGANIHGIIFGASHLRAVDKFLAISWRRNRENGNANFDIDDEATVPQLPIFGEQRLTKTQGFKKEVKDKILNRELITNADVLEYTYSAGHIPSHATEAIKELGKKVSYEANQPLVSYNSVFKQERIISYKVN